MSFKSTILRFLKGIAVEEAEHLKKAAEDAVRAGAKALAEQELDKLKVNHGVLVNDLNALIDDLKDKNDTLSADRDWGNEEIEKYQNKIEKLESAVKKADEIAAKALQRLKGQPSLKVQVVEHVSAKSKRKTFSFILQANDKDAFVATSKLPLRDIEILASTLGAQLVRQGTK